MKTARPFAGTWLPETIVLQKSDPDRQAIRDSMFEILCFPNVSYALIEAARLRHQIIPDLDRQLRALLARKPNPNPKDHFLFNKWDAELSSPEYKDFEVRRLCRSLRNMRAELRKADSRVARMHAESRRVAA